MLQKAERRVIGPVSAAAPFPDTAVLASCGVARRIQSAMAINSPGMAIAETISNAVGNDSLLLSHTSVGVMASAPTAPPVRASDIASPRFSANHSPTMLATAALVSMAKAGAMAREAMNRSIIHKGMEQAGPPGIPGQCRDFCKHGVAGREPGQTAGTREGCAAASASASCLRAVASLHAPTTSIGLSAPSRAAGNSCCAGHPLRDPNWLLGGGFCRSRCWLGYHYRIGNRLRNIDRFRAGLMGTNHARPP